MTQEGNVLAAFSVDHAAYVTGLSKSRLTRWDKLGFFSPEHVDESDKGHPFSRVYSFTDLVGLRTLAILTDDHRIPMKELRKAAGELEKRVTRPWSEIALAVVKRKVVFDLDTSPRDTEGQLVGKHVPLPTIASQVAAKAESLRNRRSELFGTTERHKYVVHNSEVLSGTRIPVTAITSFIESGYTDAQILEEYPSLTKIDVQFVRLGHKVAA